MKYWYPYEKANLLLFPRQIKPNMDLQRHANPSLSLKVVNFWGMLNIYFVIHVILLHRMSEWFKKISITSNKLLELNLFVETFYYFRFLLCLSKMPYFFLITIKMCAPWLGNDNENYNTPCYHATCVLLGIAGLITKWFFLNFMLLSSFIDACLMLYFTIGSYVKFKYNLACFRDVDVYQNWHDLKK